MSDELQDRGNNADFEPKVSRFIDWVTGRSGDQMPVIHVANVARRAIARELYRKLGSDEIGWYLALARISEIDHLELLKSILRESWKRSRGPASDADTSEDDSILVYQEAVKGALVLLVMSLSLSAIDTPGNIHEGKIRGIYGDLLYDPVLPHRFFSWSKAKALAGEKSRRTVYLQVEGQSEREIVFNVEHGSAELRSIYAILQIIWSGPSGVSLAQRLIKVIPSDQLIAAGTDLFGTLTVLITAVGKLDINEARKIGEDPGVADIVAKEMPELNVTTGSRFDRKYRRREPEIYASLVNSGIYKVLPLLSMKNLERYALPFGKVVALKLQAEGVQFNAETVGRLLNRPLGEVEHTTVCGVALLWADLTQLADYIREGGHQDQIRGVSARLSRHYDSWPEVWMASAHDILDQAEAVGPYGPDLLAVASARHPMVRDALQNIAQHDSSAAIRDRAEGLIARIDGVLAPSESLSRWVADSAARAFDGTPVFPRPLSPLAHTWIGSVEVEEIISQGIRQAESRFSNWAKSQGASSEELVTGNLLSELEAAFRVASMRLSIGSPAAQDQEISVSQRPVTKTEEREWGCDIALLLNAQIVSTVKLQAAELIQIKKSQAFADDPSGYPAEKWRIDIRQLTALLKMSQSAAYWLILSTGEILCVTARWVHALTEGRDALTQGSVTLGYNELRHTAIPVGQYILEIFLGTWAGSIEPEAVSFAKGENSRLTPRYIFEVSITAGADQRDQQ